MLNNSNFFDSNEKNFNDNKDLIEQKQAPQNSQGEEETGRYKGME
ncbi:15364_t:CDS:1, partial [Acaulospora morrowiae]